MNWLLKRVYDIIKVPNMVWSGDVSCITRPRYKIGACTMSDIIPRTSGVYKITCIANKRIYIGSAANLYKRKYDHFRTLRLNQHHNPIMQNAWNKYGEQSFTFEVLEIVLPISLTAREQYWFNKFKPFPPRGFNILPEAGTTLGREYSPEAIENIRQGIAKRRPPTPEAIERLKHIWDGRKHSPETKEKIRQAHLGKKKSPEHIEKMRQAQLGKKQSPERAEMSRRAALGRKRSPETREKMSQASKGRKKSPESIEKRKQTMIAKGYWKDKNQHDRYSFPHQSTRQYCAHRQNHTPL